MHSTDCRRGRLLQRSQLHMRMLRIDALATFFLVHAATGLVWVPTPQQLSPSQSKPPSQTTGQCCCYFSMGFASRECSELSWTQRRLTSSDVRGASATSSRRPSAFLPIMSAALLHRNTIVHLGRSVRIRDSSTSIRGSGGQDTSLTASTPDTAAIELNRDAANAVTDNPTNGKNNSSHARVAVGADGENDFKDKLGEEAGGGGGWGARFGLRRRRNTENIDPGNGGKEGSQERTGIFTYDWENGPRVKWVASKRSKAVVEEGPRKLSEYLALPPTEYSVLDPKMITRLTEDTFKMDCGTLNIVGTKVNPLLFMRVDVRPEEKQANIVVEKVELDGSEAVRGAGGTFNVTSTTIVTSAEVHDGNPRARELQTRADIEIDILVPNENFVPLGVLSKAGSFVMQRVFDIGLPQFTRFLKKDYAKWKDGDDSRMAVASENESLIDSPDL